MKRRFIGVIALLLVVTFYAFGTGFDFFFRFLYVLLMVTGIGFVWARLNLYGIELNVTRDANRGQVGGYLVGQVSICLLYTSPSPRDKRQSRMPSSA